MTTKVKLNFDNANEYAKVRFNDAVAASPNEYDLNGGVAPNTNVLVTDIYDPTPTTPVAGVISRHSTDPWGPGVPYIDTALWTCTENGSGGTALDPEKYYKMTVNNTVLTDTDDLIIDVEPLYFMKANIPASFNPIADTLVNAGTLSSGLDYYLYLDSGVLKVTSVEATALAGDPVLTGVAINDSALVQKGTIEITSSGSFTTLEVGRNDGGSFLAHTAPEAKATFETDKYIKFKLPTNLNTNLIINITIKDDHPTSTASVAQLTLQSIMLSSQAENPST